MYITFIGYAMLIALVFQALLLLVPPPQKKGDELQLRSAFDPIASFSPDVFVV
jgi:hypothetical protein